MRLHTFVLFMVACCFIGGFIGGYLIVSHYNDQAMSPTSSRAVEESCRLRARPVVVNYEPNSRYRRILDHIWDATREGHPTLLTIDRDGADQRREDALRGIPTKPGFDRDEYPPAVALEGGEDADVRYVPSSENRSAGAKLGAILRAWCDGQTWRFERKPGPK